MGQYHKIGRARHSTCRTSHFSELETGAQLKGQYHKIGRARHSTCRTSHFSELEPSSKIKRIGSITRLFQVELVTARVELHISQSWNQQQKLKGQYHKIFPSRARHSTCRRHGPRMGGRKSTLTNHHTDRDPTTNGGTWRIKRHCRLCINCYGTG